ncbi:DUF6894 family protein [Mesorhizobium sp. 128a]
MSRYFFHVLNGKALVDEVGVELIDLNAMRNEAIRSSGEMLSTGQQTWAGEAWQMVVTDETETVVFSVRYSVDRHGL